MLKHFQCTKGDGGWCNCGKRYPCGTNAPKKVKKASK